MGIKEVPIDELLLDPLDAPLSSACNGPSGPPSLVSRTHFMFSHTIKGQPYNMPLLARFLGISTPASVPQDELSRVDNTRLNLLPSLVDYELLTDSRGKRTVGFGWYAGGMFTFSSHPVKDIFDPFCYVHPRVVS